MTDLVFHIDSSTPAAAREFERCIQNLTEIGWSIATESDTCLLLKATVDSAPRLKIIKIVDPDNAETVKVIDPNHNDILNILGLTGMENDLARSVTTGHMVDKVVIGFNWVLVKAGDLCGIARTPSRDT